MSAGSVVVTGPPATVPPVVYYPERQLIAVTVPQPRVTVLRTGRRDVVALTGRPAVVRIIAPTRELITLATRGPQGPPGPKGDTGDPGPVGPPGGAYFEYTRDVSSPASVWVINHNLGRKVQVTVFDLADRVVYADIEHGSVNQTTITFAQPFSGSAILG